MGMGPGMPFVADTSMLVTLSKGRLIDSLPVIGVVCLLTDIMWDSELEPLLAAHPGLAPKRMSLTEDETVRVFELKRRNRRLSVADTSAHVLALRVGRPLLTRDGPLERCSTVAGIRCLDLKWWLDEFARKRLHPDLLRTAVDRVQATERGSDIAALSDWLTMFEASLGMQDPRRTGASRARRRRVG